MIGKARMVILAMLMSLIAVQAVKRPQIVSFHTPTPLARQFEREIYHLSTKYPLKGLAMPEIKEYKDESVSPNSSLDMFDITLVTPEINLTGADIRCMENQINLIKGKDSGIFVFHSNYRVIVGDKTYTGECIFNVGAYDTSLIKEFGFADAKAVINPRIHIHFKLNVYSVSESDTTAYKALMDSALKKYSEGDSSTVGATLTTKLNKDLQDFYSKDYVNNLKISFTTDFPQFASELDVNYIEAPTTVKDEETQRTAISFKRSGAVKGIETSHPATTFSAFDFAAKTPQIFLSRTIFDDIISKISSHFEISGKLTQSQAEIYGLPYRLDIAYFSKILPSILNSYSPADAVQVQWAIYGVKLNYDSASNKLSAIAKLDCTFYSNPRTPEVRQIYSFDADLTLDISVESSDKSFNLLVKNAVASKVNVRESYGASKFPLLKEWLRLTLNKSLVIAPYKLFQTPLDLSFFYENQINSKIVEGGILLS